jgi:cell division protein FtsB
VTAFLATPAIPGRPARDERALGTVFDDPDAPGLMAGEGSGPAGTDDPGGASGQDPVDLSGLSVAGLTRRRVAWLAAFAVAAWVVIALTRQVGDVAAVNARADDLRAAIAVREADLAALEDELELIQRPEYIALQARAYRLGGSDEIPFALAGEPPALSPNAPGSAAVAVGAEVERREPLEVWLELLFGPAG